MIEALIAGLFGLLIGSFLNVCIYRLPRDLSVVRPRSFCPECERTIAWYDNIPLLSFLLLGRKCRHCRASINWRYPLVELLTGIFFSLAIFREGLTAEGYRLCVLCAILIALIFTDLADRILPDEFTLGGVVLGLVFAWLAPLRGSILVMLLGREIGLRWSSVAEGAVAAVATGGMLWLIAEVYLRLRGREGMGLGDVKMIAMVGAFLGLNGALATLILGSLAGSLIGVAYVWLARKDPATYELPFGSFLGAAALAVAIWGESWAEWWIGIAG